MSSSCPTTRNKHNEREAIPYTHTQILIYTQVLAGCSPFHSHSLSRLSALHPGMAPHSTLEAGTRLHLAPTSPYSLCTLDGSTPPMTQRPTTDATTAASESRSLASRQTPVALTQPHTHTNATQTHTQMPRRHACSHEARGHLPRPTWARASSRSRLLVLSSAPF